MLLVRIHRKPFRPILKVPTIGELTAVSHVLIGMALAGAGYHLMVHALGLPQFRGPLRLALVISGIFIVCTILADGFDVAGEETLTGEDDDANSDEGFREPEKWSDRS
ncbi:hypothetical protein ABWH91_01170 [Phycisphaerales bacterium ac7]